ncbi:MAG: recombination regulator RecX [Nevskiales bacterium]|nr:recombination regulator RecX [Nevskiales bacterium]
MAQPSPPKDPRVKAIELLARREHSARELRRKLEQRGIGEDRAAAAVEELARDGWQNDARYAETRVRGRIQQGYGPVRIAAELRTAGVSSDDIRQALDDAEADWYALAAAVHAKHFGARPRTSAERARHYRYLQGRGFDGGQIEAALKGDSSGD